MGTSIALTLTLFLPCKKIKMKNRKGLLLFRPFFFIA